MRAAEGHGRRTAGPPSSRRAMATAPGKRGAGEEGPPGGEGLGAHPRPWRRGAEAGGVARRAAARRVTGAGREENGGGREEEVDGGGGRGRRGAVAEGERERGRGGRERGECGGKKRKNNYDTWVPLVVVGIEYKFRE